MYENLYDVKFVVYNDIYISLYRGFYFTYIELHFHVCIAIEAAYETYLAVGLITSVANFGCSFNRRFFRCFGAKIETPIF